MGEAISQIEQKEVKAPETVGLPPSLDPHYQEDLHERWRDLILPTFTDPLFIPSMARAVFEVVRPPVVLKALPLASTREAAFTPPSPKNRVSGPEASKLEEPTPGTLQPSLQVPEQSGRASDTDSGRAEEPTSEEVLPPRSLKVRLPLGLLKCSHETVPRMGLCPPKCKRNQRPRKVRPPPRPDLLRWPSVKFGLSCTKRIFQRSGTFGPRSSNWTIEMKLPKRY